MLPAGIVRIIRQVRHLLLRLQCHLRVGLQVRERLLVRGGINPRRRRHRDLHHVKWKRKLRFGFRCGVTRNPDLDWLLAPC